LAEVDAPQAAAVRQDEPRQVQPGAEPVPRVTPQQVVGPRGTFLPDALSPVHGPERLRSLEMDKSAWQLAAQPHAVDLH
jgi:hypothetical protein